MYDLLSINGYDLPDILPGKGEITVQPNPKYDTHDVEDGGKVIDEIEESEDTTNCIIPSREGSIPS